MQPLDGTDGSYSPDHCSILLNKQVDIESILADTGDDIEEHQLSTSLSSEKPDPVVQITVQKSLFVTTASTLLRREPDSLFARTLTPLVTATQVAIDRTRTRSLQLTPTLASTTNTLSAFAQSTHDQVYNASCDTNSTVMKQIRSRSLPTHQQQRQTPQHPQTIEMHFDNNSPQHFLTILNYLRTGTISLKLSSSVAPNLSDDIHLKQLIQEATFFQCHGMVSQIKTQLSRLKSKFTASNTAIISAANTNNPISTISTNRTTTAVAKTSPEKAIWKGRDTGIATEIDDDVAYQMMNKQQQQQKALEKSNVSYNNVNNRDSCEDLMFHLVL